MSEKTKIPYIIGVDMSQVESESAFVKLRPGMVFTVQAGAMEGERPKPGERCLMHNAFECVAVVRTVDMLMYSVRDGMSRWQRLLFKVGTWFRLGPKEYKNPICYKVKYLGVEG